METDRGSAFDRVAAWRGTPVVTLAARLGLAGVFFWAGFAKISDLQSSVRAVRAYRVLPEGLAQVVGYALPPLEIALAVLLLLGIGLRVTGAVSALLLVVFLAGIAQAAARGLSIDCGCFGGGGDIAAGQTRYLQETFRDLGLLLLAGWVTVFPRSPLALDAALGLHDIDHVGSRDAHQEP